MMKTSPLSLCLALSLFSAAVAAETKVRPNILWLTCEDTGPQLGCYGDPYAHTPNLDRLAARGMRYLNAWSNAPVCAPARTTIISGVYPPSTGSEHMRSMAPMPPQMRMYPQFLRDAGYYCTNNSKEDYNLVKPAGVWDESSGKGHWRNRQPGQPFFAIFNFTITHESQLRTRPHTWVHDPAKVRVPAYHPDTLEVRQDWAQYYDNITTMDGQCGKMLTELEEEGLADDTIVFYYGDHGSGMPRSKRWPYNSGLSVPLIVYVPEKLKNLAPKDYQPGGTSDRLVGFIDLAPTLMSLAGAEPRDWMQGHAFMGPYQTPAPQYMFGFRGRMDERYDMVRTVRDGRYQYIRNYMPHKIYGQHVAYMFQTPTTQVWKSLYDQGKLSPPKTCFWETKPAEELYDLQNDPDEVHNLSDSPVHQEILIRLRKAQQDWELAIRDVGFLPEDEIHSRSQGSSPYEMGHDRSKYPLERIMATAELASSLKAEALRQLVAAFEDQDSAVRYWAAMGILMRGPSAVQSAREPLLAALADSSGSVRAIAGQALGQYGNDAEAAQALDVLAELAHLGKNSVYVSMLALNAIDAMGLRAKPALEALRQLPQSVPKMPERTSGYVSRLLQDLLTRFGERPAAEPAKAAKAKPARPAKGSKGRR